MRVRSQKKERLDIGNHTLLEYRRCLKLLGRVGRWLGGDRAIKCALRELKSQPKTILDVGCGGGQLAGALAKEYPSTTVTGIDRNKEAIRFAKEETKGIQNVSFRSVDKLEGSYDIVMATLVCHHMSDDEIVDFFKKSSEIAKEAVIINDLHRHPLAWLGYALVAPFLFPSQMVISDGLLSVRRGFTRKELEAYLKKAGFTPGQYKIQWKFPFRWVVTINNSFNN